MSGIDADGNLFFLSTAFLLGAAFGGGSYALTTEHFQLDKFLGYAMFGGFAAYAGAAAGQYSQVLQNAVSSSINSIGANLIENTPLSVNFGFASLDQRGFSFANPFGGENVLSDLSAASGWLALGQDLNKLDYHLSTTPEERAQTAALKERVKTEGHHPKGETTYLEVNESDVDQVGTFVKSSGDVNEFSIPGMDNSVPPTAYRSKAFHLKAVDGLISDDGRITFPGSGEIHFNKVPSRNLLSHIGVNSNIHLGAVVHGVVDGRHVDFMNSVVSGLGTALEPIYDYRDGAVNAFQLYHKYRYAYTF